LILYCIPTPLGGAPREALPGPAITTIRSLGDFVVENAKSARAFLGALDMPVRELSIKVIGEERDPLAPLREKRSLVPLIGPSSIVLALMASGLEGQRFAFCGYLPREAGERGKRIRELEQRSRREKETQIFIETPYRNEALLGALLEACREKTRLCIAADLTLPSENVSTKTVAEWRRAKAVIGKRPAVFLLLAD
jgi:16S rRNA (cytidine1402-2'-O)-methyltransferase